MTPSQAYSIASQWGSYMSVGDPGACFYCFHPNDGRPSDESHRADCIAWARHCLSLSTGESKTRREDRRRLRELIEWLQTCEVRT